MPRTTTITLYQYHELDTKAKEKATQWWLGCWDSNDDNQITELFEDELREAGYPVADINWSLSRCQGDGVAFYTRNGYGGDLMRIWLRRISRGWPRADRRRLYTLVRAHDVSFELSVQRNSYGHRYSHANTMDVTVSWEASSRREHEAPTASVAELDQLTARLQHDVTDDIRSLSRALEAKGYAEIEHMQSEESVASAMEANQYEFTITGERYVRR